MFVCVYKLKRRFIIHEKREKKIDFFFTSLKLPFFFIVLMDLYRAFSHQTSEKFTISLIHTHFENLLIENKRHQQKKTKPREKKKQNWNNHPNLTTRQKCTSFLKIEHHADEHGECFKNYFTFHFTSHPLWIYFFFLSVLFFVQQIECLNEEKMKSG